MAVYSNDRYSIIISDYQNKRLFWKEITAKNYSDMNQMRGREIVGLFSALLIPVRTNNWQNLAQDALFPTICNHAIKINFLVTKILAVLGALFLDVLTLPIRLCTCIPRIIYNNSLETLSVKIYLKEQLTVDEKILENDFIKVQLTKIVMQDKSGANLEGEDVTLVKNEKTSLSFLTSEYFINLIEVPEVAQPYKSGIYSNDGLTDSELAEIMTDSGF